MSKGFKARAEPKHRFEGRSSHGARKLHRGLEKSVPQQVEYHEGIRTGKKSGTSGRTGYRSAKRGEDRKLDFYCDAECGDMLPCRSRVNATQCSASRVDETRRGIGSSFEQSNELFARKRASPDEMLGQDPFGIDPPCITRSMTEDRHNTDSTPFAATPNRPAVRVGVERELVVFSAERATTKDDGYLG